MVHEYHETVGLNSYERWYFQKFFGNNLKRLRRFRKIIAKEQSRGFYANTYTDPFGTFRSFMVKGNKYRSIWLTRKKVDAYIREVVNKDKEND